MAEPDRIGLTAETAAKLDELLDEINLSRGEKGVALIKFDLYRLAVAVGIKKGVTPPYLEGKSIASFRVSELDKDGVLYTVLQNSGVVSQHDSIYSYLERLAENEIRAFYSANQQTGQLPFEDIFSV